MAGLFGASNQNLHACLRRCDQDRLPGQLIRTVLPRRILAPYPARTLHLGVSLAGPCGTQAPARVQPDRVCKIPMEQSLPQELVKQVGGSFRLTTLLQKRVRELVRGQRPLYETRERNYIKIASEELKRGLIELVADEEQNEPTL